MLTDLANPAETDGTVQVGVANNNWEAGKAEPAGMIGMAGGTQIGTGMDSDPILVISRLGTNTRRGKGTSTTKISPLLTSEKIWMRIKWTYKPFIYSDSFTLSQNSH